MSGQHTMQYKVVHLVGVDIEAVEHFWSYDEAMQSLKSIADRHGVTPPIIRSLRNSSGYIDMRRAPRVKYMDEGGVQHTWEFAGVNQL